jgi:hypothetical protein
LPEASGISPIADLAGTVKNYMNTFNGALKTFEIAKIAVANLGIAVAKRSDLAGWARQDSSR